MVWAREIPTIHGSVLGKLGQGRRRLLVSFFGHQAVVIGGAFCGTKLGHFGEQARFSNAFAWRLIGYSSILVKFLNR